jgi:D-sedoheptulose 7-phosphate isomerase
MFDARARLYAAERVVAALAADEGLLAALHSATLLCIAALRAGGRVLFCGNGGSAADAQHLAAELSGRYYLDRPPLDSDALHTNSSYVTAVANDYGFSEIFARQVRAKGRPGDVLIGISTSGNSENVILAMQTAGELGMRRVAMTGQGGGRLAALAEVILRAPSIDTPRIQEAHILMGHILCEAVERAMFVLETDA